MPLAQVARFKAIVDESPYLRRRLKLRQNCDSFASRMQRGSLSTSRRRWCGDFVQDSPLMTTCNMIVQ